MAMGFRGWDSGYQVRRLDAWNLGLHSLVMEAFRRNLGVLGNSFTFCLLYNLKE